MSSQQQARLRPFKPIPFGRYTLLSGLAAGGMGEVFLARFEGHSGFEKLCVIKKILPQLAKDPEFRQRFLNEARTLVKLTHGAIAQVLDSGVLDGEPYLAIEYVDGKDLRRIAAKVRDRQQPMPLTLVLHVISRVLDALSYAHRKRDEDDQELGLVHRDISPQNILISYEGEVKVIDFGLAKSRLNAQKTHPSIVLGKFLYMAPEQARHQQVDRRTDLYAVGLCLYELIAGKHPFESVHPGELMMRVSNPVIPSLREVDPLVPPGVDALVKKALAVEPEGRFQTAEELRSALLSCLYEIDRNVGSEGLAAFMREAFSAEYATERRILSGLRDVPLASLQPPTSNPQQETGVFNALPASLGAAEQLAVPEPIPSFETVRHELPVSSETVRHELPASSETQRHEALDGREPGRDGDARATSSTPERKARAVLRTVLEPKPRGQLAGSSPSAPTVELPRPVDLIPAGVGATPNPTPVEVEAVSATRTPIEVEATRTPSDGEAVTPKGAPRATATPPEVRAVGPHEATQPRVIVADLEVERSGRTPKPNRPNGSPLRAAPATGRSATAAAAEPSAKGRPRGAPMRAAVSKPSPIASTAVRSDTPVVTDQVLRPGSRRSTSRTWLLFAAGLAFPLLLGGAYYLLIHPRGSSSPRPLDSTAVGESPAKLPPPTVGTEVASADGKAGPDAPAENPAEGSASVQGGEPSPALDGISAAPTAQASAAASHAPEPAGQPGSTGPAGALASQGPTETAPTPNAATPGPAPTPNAATPEPAPTPDEATAGARPSTSGARAGSQSEAQRMPSRHPLPAVIAAPAQHAEAPPRKSAPAKSKTRTVESAASREWQRARAIFERQTRLQSCDSSGMALLCRRFRALEKDFKAATTAEAQQRLLPRILTMQDLLSNRGGAN